MKKLVKEARFCGAVLKEVNGAHHICDSSPARPSGRCETHDGEELGYPSEMNFIIGQGGDGSEEEDSPAHEEPTSAEEGDSSSSADDIWGADCWGLHSAQTTTLNLFLIIFTSTANRDSAEMTCAAVCRGQKLVVARLGLAWVQIVVVDFTPMWPLFLMKPTHMPVLHTMDHSDMQNIQIRAYFRHLILAWCKKNLQLVPKQHGAISDSTMNVPVS